MARHQALPTSRPTALAILAKAIPWPAHAAPWGTPGRPSFLGIKSVRALGAPKDVIGKET